MKKWFFRIIVVPAMLILGISFRISCTAFAAKSGASFDAATKTYTDVSTYSDLKKAIEASNKNGGNYTVCVTGDIILEQIIYITETVHVVSVNGRHTITTNGYSEDSGIVFRVEGTAGWVTFEGVSMTNGSGGPIFQVFSDDNIGKLELNNCDFSNSVCPVCYESTAIGKISNCNFSHGVQGVVFREGGGSVTN